jgi:hypothetical protein
MMMNESADLAKDRTPRPPMVGLKYQAGRIGYILLWLLGVPIPVLFLFYLLRGCT